MSESAEVAVQDNCVLSLERCSARWEGSADGHSATTVKRPSQVCSATLSREQLS